LAARTVCATCCAACSPSSTSPSRCPGACTDAWNGILKAQLDNRHRPCSFIEIMPRLTEKKKAKAKIEGRD
jgi:hypothetical protein